MLDWIIDRFWPRITGEEETHPELETFFDQSNRSCLPEISRFLFQRLEQLKQRHKSVESKLMSLLTLTSTLTTVIVAALAAVVTIGAVDKEIEIYIIVIASAVAYITTQLTRALLSTISGLSRREYLQFSETDIVPESTESSQDYQIRLYNLMLNQIRHNDWVINRIVEDMTLSHVALKNAIFGTLAMIPLLMVVFIVSIN